MSKQVPEMLNPEYGMNLHFFGRLPEPTTEEKLIDATNRYNNLFDLMKNVRHLLERGHYMTALQITRGIE